MIQLQPEHNSPVWGEHTRDDTPHHGHVVHGHAAHPGLLMCQCGEIAGTYSFVLSDPGTPEPPPCPRCSLTNWSSR